MKYVLGIDQGGTKTAALVCDLNGNIVGIGYEDGLASVYFDDAEGLYIKRIVSAAQNACTMAGIQLKDVAAVCGGLSGADWDFEYPILRERLYNGLHIEDSIVLNDCIPAMRGGSAAKACAVICAGSGLNVALQRADGSQLIYGYYIDDAHQGAGALGTRAMRKVMEAHLGICGPTLLTELILSHTGYHSEEALMIAVTMGKHKLETKTLAPLLLKAYSAKDKEATIVAEEFAAGIAQYITAGMQRLQMCNDMLEIVFSGGVFKGHGALLADKIFDCIAKQEPHVRKVHAKYEPVCGAALTLLDREYSGALPEAVASAFDESAKAHKLLRSLH